MLHLLILIQGLSTMTLMALAHIDQLESPSTDREAKIGLFNIVRFKNEPCVSSSNDNGTCYTADECNNKGGQASGSCASSFGVCCVFVIGCGGTVTENCTIFSSSSVSPGTCNIRICKCSPDICQLRLDFITFVITGPSTLTTSVVRGSKGLIVDLVKGVQYSLASQCLTDKFSVTSSISNVPPVICGTNSGQHMYVDALDSCNEASFQFASNANAGDTALANRQWSIKISQYSCMFNNLAPPGCVQYFSSTSGTGIVQSYNFGGSPPYHLANQQQTNCIRRESNMCRICWSATNNADFQISGSFFAKTSTKNLGFNTGVLCCQHGLATTSLGFDCIVIPGASKMGAAAFSNAGILPSVFCGRSKGLATGTNQSKTVCSRTIPFRMDFLSDNIEISAINEPVRSAGFRLAYVQKAC